jgi:hypothetical protein
MGGSDVVQLVGTLLRVQEFVYWRPKRESIERPRLAIGHGYYAGQWRRGQQRLVG